MTSFTPGGAILHTQLPFYPWMSPQLNRLPGLKPIEPNEWIVRDEAYGAQMAYRDRLLSSRRDRVLTTSPHAEAAAAELLSALVDQLSREPDYSSDRTHLHRPDGVAVNLKTETPLFTAAQLVQEDLCLLIEHGAEHRLVGGALCFPAHWTLQEKMGRSLFGVHRPVAEYDARLSERVERILANLQPDRPILRANVLIYTDPELHQPAKEGVAKRLVTGAPRYVRVERQTLRRLARTGAIVFAIHTYLIRAEDLPCTAFDALAARRPELLALGAS